MEGRHTTAESPDDRTPGRGETDNEEAGEDNHGNTGRVGARVRVEDLVADRGPDHETDEHPGGTDHETVTTTVVLNDVQTGQGHAEVDRTEDDLGDVGVGQTNTLEDGGAVVEDEVGTGQLLQGLQGDTQHGTVEHARAGEDLVPGSLADGTLLVELLLHVRHLLRDDTVVGGDTVELGHDLAGLLHTAVTVGVARGLGQEQGTDTEDQGPGKANAHGDAPRGSRLNALGAEVDNVGDEDTEGDEQLEGADHGTADLARSRLTLVHGDNAGQSTDTQTGDPTAQSYLVPLVDRSDLHDDTDDVDEGPEGDGELATNLVRNGGSDEGANHSSDGELSKMSICV